MARGQLGEPAFMRRQGARRSASVEDLRDVPVQKRVEPPKSAMESDWGTPTLDRQASYVDEPAFVPESVKTSPAPPAMEEEERRYAGRRRGYGRETNEESMSQTYTEPQRRRRAAWSEGAEEPTTQAPAEGAKNITIADISAVQDRIRKIQELIEEAQVPGFGNFGNKDKCVIDRNQMMELLSKLQTSLPNALEQARQVLEERANIIGNAKSEAAREKREIQKLKEQSENEIGQAKDEAKRKTDEYRQAADAYKERICREAKETAQGIIDDAELKKQHIIESAHQKAAEEYNEQEIIRRAQVEAQEIVENARTRADDMEAQARNAVDSLFSGVAKSLEGFAGDMRKERDSMLNVAPNEEYRPW